MQEIFQPFIDFIIIAAILLIGMAVVFVILTLWREHTERSTVTYYTAQQDPNTGLGWRTADEAYDEITGGPEARQMAEDYFELMKEKDPEAYKKLFKQ